MPVSVGDLIYEFSKDMHRLFGQDFRKIIVYGSYYVAFYAVKAVLATESIDFKRHKDAVAYFNKTYGGVGAVSQRVGKTAWQN